MAAYSALDIQMILELNDIMLNSSPKLTKDESQIFDIYARLMTGPLHFLKDTAEYVLKTEERASNRRVAFFLNSNQAIIVEYNQINRPCAQILLQIIKTHRLTTIDQLITHCLTYLQGLYKDITLYTVGFSKNDPLVASLNQMIQKSYPHARHIFSPLMTGKIDDTLTVETVCGLLKKNIEFTIPANLASVIAEHHQLCASSLTHWLEQLNEENPAEHQTIIEAIRILLLYTLLQDQLIKITLDDESLLGDVLEKAYQLKTHFFSIECEEPQKYFRYFPLKSLTRLLSLRSTPMIMTEELHAQQQKQLQEIVDWETGVQQRWNTYQHSWEHWLWHHAKKTTQTLYNNSPMGLGGGIATWITKHAESHIDWIKSARRVIKATIKLAVFSTTLSTRLANYCADSIDLLLTPDELPILTKTIGEDMGIIIASLSLTPMGFLIMFMLPIATKQMHHLLKRETILLQTARVQSYEKKLPSLSNLLRINHLLLALTIAGYTREYRILIQALIGTMGSIGMVGLGDAVFDEFKEEITLTPEDRHYFRFLLSSSGLQLGNLIAESYYLIQHKITAQEALLHYLDEGLKTNNSDVTHYQATFPNLATSPRLWLTAENPFTLFWVGKKNVHEAHCQIVSDVFSDTGTIECEAPHLTMGLIAGF